jgi:hypothetical protein
VATDGVDAPTTLIGPSSLTVTMPAHAPGRVAVVVTNGDGRSASVPDGFTYIAPLPITIESVQPAVGSTEGGTLLAIFGASLKSGATVTIDGKSVPAEFGDFEALYLDTPAHAAGAVDITVTNPDGGTSRLDGGFTYAPPQTFSFAGRWDAWARPAWVSGGLGFRVENDRVTGLWCESEIVNLVPTPLPVVTDGAFSILAVGGGQITARIVAAGEAAGTSTLPGCPSGTWYAYRR